MLLLWQLNICLRDCSAKHAGCKRKVCLSTLLKAIPILILSCIMSGGWFPWTNRQSNSPASIGESIKCPEIQINPPILNISWKSVRGVRAKAQVKKSLAMPVVIPGRC
jgi:hypothetical protein